MILGDTDDDQQCVQDALVVEKADERVLERAADAAGGVWDQEYVAHKGKHKLHCLYVLLFDVVTLSSTAQTPQGLFEQREQKAHERACKQCHLVLAEDAHLLVVLVYLVRDSHRYHDQHLH